MIKNKISKNVFSKFGYKINVVDAGNDLFNGGRSCWQTIGKENLNIWGFDGDEKLVRIKNQEAKDNNWDHKYFAYAVADKNGKFMLKYSRNETHGSGFLPNYEIIKPWNYDGNVSMFDHMFVTDSVELPQIALDSFLDSDLKIDFIKLNIQGSELDALNGFNKGIDNCVGVEVELPFNSYYKDSPTFGDVDNFLKKKGFYLFDILAPNIAGFKNQSLYHHPIRLLANHNWPKKQLFEAHVLYLKNPLIQHEFLSKNTDGVFFGGGTYDLEKVFKLAIIAEGYGQLEYSFALVEWLINFNPELSDELRELITIWLNDSATYYSQNFKYCNFINRIYRRVNMIFGNKILDII